MGGRGVWVVAAMWDPKAMSSEVEGMEPGSRAWEPWNGAGGAGGGGGESGHGKSAWGDEPCGIMGP